MVNRTKDRRYWDGEPITVFMLRGGREHLYKAKVPRWTSDDSLAYDEDGQLKANIRTSFTGTVDGPIKKVITGRVVPIGNRLQFIPLKEVPPAKRLPRNLKQIAAE